MWIFNLCYSLFVRRIIAIDHNFTFWAWLDYNQISVENFKQNKALLPSIVDAIMFCARQQIAFRGHRNDKINFDEAPACNEGNFVAIICMLAECTSSLKKHLISCSRNARYVSKTIQNEIIAVYADLISEHFRQCLQKCPRFA